MTVWNWEVGLRPVGAIWAYAPVGRQKAQNKKMELKKPGWMPAGFSLYSFQ